MPRKEWRWDGGLWSFIETVQWAFVFHRLGKEGAPGWQNIMTSPERVRAQAEEYGMTWKAIAREMVRHGNDALSMLGVHDARTSDAPQTDHRITENN